MHYFYFQLDGAKDLILDEELMKPLDQITGVKFLKVEINGAIR